MLRILLVISMLAFCSGVNADTLIACDRLVDGKRSEIFKDKVIRIREDRIVAVEDGPMIAAPTDRAISISGLTCLPGLMDMHVHITSQQGPNNFGKRFRLDPEDRAYSSVPYARRTLMAGFTTVRDLGSSYGLAIAMRNAIKRGDIVGPRIYASGKSLATTGGHADPTNGVNDALRGDPGPAEGVVNSVEDAKKAVRQRYKEGADLIKITATGGVLSQAKSGQNPQFTEEEIAAIIATARDYGFKVAAHAHGAEGMKRAIRAGIDSIEHGTYMDAEAMRLMKRHGTTYVPTIIAGKFVAEKAEIDGYFSDMVRPKAREIGPLIQQTFAEAYKAGVKIAFGTDCGVCPHGDNWKEFVYMVEAGMPAMEAIQSATMGGAVLLGIDDELGSIEPGKLADIVGIRGNPIDDINNMEHAAFVMKEGVVYKGAEDK
jgi:imidazolonepropionase-like amidohydrolase